MIHTTTTITYGLSAEALATLVTGFLAVGAAIVVGMRQNRILRRQTDISANQTELEKVKVRTDLFDKRYATYEATADLMVHSNQYWEDRDRLGLFLLKMRESQFLFRPSVYKELKEIFSVFNTIHILRQSMNIGIAEGNPVSDGGARELEMLTWWAHRLETLHEIFEADLLLAMPEEHLPAKRGEE